MEVDIKLKLFINEFPFFNLYEVRCRLSREGSHRTYGGLFVEGRMHVRLPWQPIR